MLPGAGGTQQLPRAIGTSKAMDLCLSARVLDADEADRYGPMSRVVGAADQALHVSDPAAAGASIQGFDRARVRARLGRRSRLRAAMRSDGSDGGAAAGRPASADRAH
jgi:enoyl-CoA hydratase/carnithine racemase